MSLVITTTESEFRSIANVGLINASRVELIARLSNPSISPEWDELIQMAKAGTLY